MDESKLNVKQAIDVLGLSKSTIYTWIKEGKLRYADSPRGKIILVTPDEIKKIRELNEIYSGQEIPAQYETIPVQYEKVFNQSETVQEGSGMNDNSVIIAMLDKIDMMTQKIEEYAKEAGQVKLLTDNNKFYQEEYFRLKYELESLTKLNQLNLDKIKELESEKAALEKEMRLEIDRLKAENTNLKEEANKKSGWKFWK